MCTLPQMITLFLLFQSILLPVLVPIALQPLVLAMAVHAVQILLTSAGIIGINQTRLSSAEPSVPGGETSCPAGGCFHPACWFYRFFSSVSSKQAILWFLVVLVFPAPVSSSTSWVKLLTADGFSLSCSGSRIILLNFGSCSFDWLFQLAPV